MHRKPLTADQVRERFKQRGETITRWALRHNYKRRDVYQVLCGVAKGDYGRAHEIAVALGLKVPPEESSEAGANRNTQAREAA